MALLLREKLRIAYRIRQTQSTAIADHHLQQAERLSRAGRIARKIERIGGRDGRGVCRGWLAASKRSGAQIVRDLNNLDHEISNWRSQQSQCPPGPTPLRDLVDDLTALDEEMDDLAFDPLTEILSVVTDSITLEDICLGRFQIQLPLRKLEIGNVIALDPCRPSGNDYCTHPHVSNNDLCLGDGGGATYAAAREGRLLDFFTIVSSILHTYAKGYAYVEMDEWEGDPCHSCGERQPELARCYDCRDYFCDECIGPCCTCEEDICDGCSDRCCLCDERLCNHCIIKCERCKKYVCAECSTECEQCGESLCDRCRNDQLCSCQDDAEEDEDEDADVNENENESDASPQESDHERQEQHQ